MATRRSIVAMTIPLDVQQEEEGKPKVQESREKLINDIYDMYDLDRDGKIKSSEVRELLYSMGREPTNEDVMEFLKIADPENTGVISKEQFMDALKELYSVPDIDCDDVEEAFTVFDTDNDGKITFKDFKNILERYGTDLTSEEISKFKGDDFLPEEKRRAKEELKKKEIERMKFKGPMKILAISNKGRMLTEIQDIIDVNKNYGLDTQINMNVEENSHYSEYYQKLKDKVKKQIN